MNVFGKSKECKRNKIVVKNTNDESKDVIIVVLLMWERKEK